MGKMWVYTLWCRSSSLLKFSLTKTVKRQSLCHKGISTNNKVYCRDSVLWRACEILTWWKHKILWWPGQNIIHLIIYLLRSIRTHSHSFDKKITSTKLCCSVVLFTTKLPWLDSVHYPLSSGLYIFFCFTKPKHSASFLFGNFFGLKQRKRKPFTKYQYSNSFRKILRNRQIVRGAEKAWLAHTLFTP